VALIIMFVLKDREGNLRFLSHPKMSKIVQEDDLAYIESLLRDFLERAKLHPAALFKQLSSLAVGPLVTHETGSSLAEFPALQGLSKTFLSL
jgi:predicted component of type VI protein secretion system